MATKFKRVGKIMPAPPKHWVGNGFNVYPVFSHLAFCEALSPWLMFDYAAPKHFEPTKKRLGVGQHPHRGFETITIAFQGGVEHADSVGNRDVIGPGDVQWMTAGRGIMYAPACEKSNSSASAGRACDEASMPRVPFITAAYAPHTLAPSCLPSCLPHCLPSCLLS